MHFERVAVPLGAILLVLVLALLLSPKDSWGQFRELLQLSSLRRFVRGRSRTTLAGKLSRSGLCLLAVLWVFVVACGLTIGNDTLISIGLGSIVLALFGPAFIQNIRRLSMSHLMLLIACNALSIAILSQALSNVDTIGFLVASIAIGCGSFLLCFSIAQNFKR